MRVYGDDGDDDGDQEVSVGLADLAVVDDGARLKSSGLGSCVAVALRDDDAGVAGLLHFMLPSSAEIDDDTPEKFADTGLDRVVEEMEDRGADRDRMEAKLAGGADMLDLTDKQRLIGTRNVRAVRERLDEIGIPVVGEDTGGEHGRTVTYDPASGTLTVRGAHVEPETV